MSDSAQRRYIENRLKEHLTLTYPAVFFEFNNTKDDPGDKQPRVFYQIMSGKGARANLGSKVDRHVGELQLDIMVPEDTGNGLRDQIADFLSGIFNEAEAVLADNSRLHFKVPGSKEMGVKNGLSRKVVSVPFWRDDDTR